MRISDWSSDVCSSDLLLQVGNQLALVQVLRLLQQHLAVADYRVERRAQFVAHVREELALRLIGRIRFFLGPLQFLLALLEFGYVGIDRHRPAIRRPSLADPHRSEEHTSELQPLMRTSYAVFCLNK